MNNSLLREYMRLRRKGWTSSAALRAARVNLAFDSNKGFVKLEAEPECDSYWDVWGENCANLSERDWKREKKSIEERLETHGYWTLVAYARASEDDEWTAVDSCGGFLGDDLKDNGYDTDLKHAALDWLVNTGIEAAEQYNELASRASYAQGGMR
jgi:hypothetical protein